MIKDYAYKGRIRSAVTVRLDGEEERDVMLVPGCIVTGLPDDHPYIASLVAQGLLEPVEPGAAKDAPETPAASKTKPKKVA